MAGASIQPRTVCPWPTTGWRTFLSWTSNPIQPAKRHPARRALLVDSHFVASVDQSRAAAEISGSCMLQPDARYALLSAYASSAVEMTRLAGDAGSRAADLGLGPVAVQGLIADVVQDLDPMARRAGLLLLRDAAPRGDGVCCAEPTQLRAVLKHLLLRALTLEQAPGHVRVMATLTGHEAHIIILSRTPETGLSHADVGRPDLSAPQRLVKAMGGSLVLEPRRGGYLPLCVALPALSAAPAFCVA